MARARFYDETGDFDDMQEETTLSRNDRLSQDPDIWEKMAEKELYILLRKIGTSEKVIKTYQRNRVIHTMIIFLFFCLFAYFTKFNIVYFIAVGIAFFIYRSRFTGIKRLFVQWKFERELNFSRFIRLLIPYLKQAGGNVSLYNVFNKILVRMDDQTDRDSLYMLMGEMGDRPGDIQPFNDFAERSSGSDMAFLIMSTIFDFQESTKDVSVINELGQMASEQMMDAIEEIINFKIKRFGTFPTKLTIATFIVMAGFMIGIFMSQIATFFSM